MTLKSSLTRIIRVIIEEAERNPAFRSDLSEAIGLQQKSKPEEGRDIPIPETETRRRGRNRRTPAVLDPVLVVRDGEEALRSALAALDIEQLKDIVSEYGMDSGKLVMKWTTAARVVDRIVEIASSRANKGHAFRKQPDPESG